METTKLRPAIKFGPGYFIREQMEYRSWTQDDLSEVIGITIKHLNKILQDKQAITLEMAKVLAEVFDTSAQYWLNLDANYRLWLEDEKSEKEIYAELKAKIYERMPIKDMLIKGWIKPFKNAEELTNEVNNYWGWDTLDLTIIEKQLLPCLTRKFEDYNQFNASYAITWYQKALNEAKHFTHNPFDKQQLENLYDLLHNYTVDTNGINQFIYELEKAGVILFVLPHLQKTYLDGAAFYSGKNPVIVYTGRYKRIDNFWFTVAHEIAHILKHIDDETPFVLDNLKDGEINKMEEEANEMAAEKLKHTQIVNYLKPYAHYLSNNRVEECAVEYKVHPSIIIGKLAHDKLISFSSQGLFNDNVLQYIDAKYQIMS